MSQVEAVEAGGGGMASPSAHAPGQSRSPQQQTLAEGDTAEGATPETQPKRRKTLSIVWVPESMKRTHNYDAEKIREAWDALSDRQKRLKKDLAVQERTAEQKEQKEQEQAAKEKLKADRLVRFGRSIRFSYGGEQHRLGAWKTQIRNQTGKRLDGAEGEEFFKTEWDKLELEDQYEILNPQGRLVTAPRRERNPEPQSVQQAQGLEALKSRSPPRKVGRPKGSLAETRCSRSHTHSQKMFSQRMPVLMKKTAELQQVNAAGEKRRADEFCVDALTFVLTENETTRQYGRGRDSQASRHKRAKAKRKDCYVSGEMLNSTEKKRLKAVHRMLDYMIKIPAPRFGEDLDDDMPNLTTFNNKSQVQDFQQERSKPRKKPKQATPQQAKGPQTAVNEDEVEFDADIEDLEED
mmetsp:Transcript_49053/g.76506  ORF Transcript_49053/g.76506 Transcript_49053/m.76506 type:complete len:408 (-) Transcript_49053:1080-2303(-)